MKRTRHRRDVNDKNDGNVSRTSRGGDVSASRLDDSVSLNSHHSSHHSHHYSSHSHHGDSVNSSSRRYKSVSAAEYRKKNEPSIKSHKSSTSSSHRSVSTSSHRSSASMRGHVKFPIEDEYHSHKEKRISLAEFVTDIPKPDSNDILLQKVHQKPSQRSRTRRRQQQVEVPPKESDDTYFSLVEGNRKPFVPAPDSSSSQFNTMTYEEIELQSTMNTSHLVNPPPKLSLKPTRTRSMVYDYEVFFAARFAASARNVTINDYYEDLAPLAQKDSRQRASLAATITVKVNDLLQGKSRSLNDWEKLTDTLSKWNIEEIIYLAKKYIDASDLQLTKFFTTEDIDPNTNANNVPVKYVDSLALTGINDPRICDRTHIFTCHLLQTDVSEIFNIIKEMPQFVERMGDIFGECVFNYVMNWILLFPEDFNPDFFRIVKSSLKEVLTVTSQSKNLIFLVLALGSALSQKLISINTINELPRIKPLIHNQWGMPPLGVPPQAIVDHFTFVEAEEIAKMSLTEVLHQKLMPIVNGFNATCNYICRHILADDVRSRARNISYWIDTMASAADSGNLFLVFEISASLNSPAIMRLHKSWNKVPVELKDKFYSVDELTNPSCNYKAMRDFVFSKQKRDTLPFVLAFVRMAEQAHALQNENGIDLMKMEVIGSLAQQVKMWAVKTYSVDDKVVAFIRSIKESQTNSPNELPIDVLSKRLEPPIQYKQ